MTEKELEKIRKLRRENEEKLQEELQKYSNANGYILFFRNGYEQACADILEVLKK